jgi:predicted LPLAT superfamily acyltransferase/glycosyltransferase involved in cell wall biosynthesis
VTVDLCAVIPSRNHYRDIGDIVAVLQKSGLSVYVIDDGSDEPARSVLDQLDDPQNGVFVFRNHESRGKGGAVCQGLRMAVEAGFSHALQIDADGQHDLGALQRFISLANENPEAIISGRPIFGPSSPTGRRFARWLTHFWVWIETLSFQIVDSMCGFRVYPLEPVMRLLTEERVGRHMDFDIEILVRMFWRGVPIVQEPVVVRYPEGNTSNFETIADNWRITCMHTRLVLTMLVRLPRILRNRLLRKPESRHWFALAERGAACGLRFSTVAYRILGRTGCLAILSPVVLYFFMTGSQQRTASRVYLSRALSDAGRPHSPTWLDSYRHFMSFAGCAVDTFAAWSGRLPPDIVRVIGGSTLEVAKKDPRGALFVVSHLGNAGLSRALLDERTRSRITVLAHTGHAGHFNEVLRRHNPDSAVNTLQVTEIGPETMIDLRERIERGEWIVIAGDRTPVGSQQRTFRVRFLGTDAVFAQGPYILAALMQCPVYLLFCLRSQTGYELFFEKFAHRVTLPRGDRETALRQCAERYASRLEHYVKKSPFQWYNFYDFWM